ncbi:MAG: nucleotidyltransferase domain-containing protein [Candidatus Micrarchaeaceae archaeon]
MPSAIQKRSYGSVTVYSIHKEQIWQELERFVHRLSERPEVLAVILFGSLAEGRLGVGSDVDLLVILSQSDRPFLERLPLYAPERFPVDVDVFPYTLEEIRRGQPLAGQALAQGRVLWCRPDFDRRLMAHSE